MRYTKRNENYTGKERKLWELENDIEDGLLVRLPCKVGDTCYYIFKDTLYDVECSRVFISDKTTFELIGKNIGTYTNLLDYNVTWFTDQELAEKKLEEMKNEI